MKVDVILVIGNNIKIFWIFDWIRFINRASLMRCENNFTFLQSWYFGEDLQNFYVQTILVVKKQHFYKQ